MSGGRLRLSIPNDIVNKYLVRSDADTPLTGADDVCKFEAYTDPRSFINEPDNSCTYMFCRIPLTELCPYLSRFALVDICLLHGIPIDHNDTRSHLIAKVGGHDYCGSCATHCTVVRVNHRTIAPSTRTVLTDDSQGAEEHHVFPPPPHTSRSLTSIMRNFCEEFSAANIEEAGCAVCGQLCRLSVMKALSESKADLALLAEEDVIMRHSVPSTIAGVVSEWDANCPVVEPTNYVCTECENALLSGQRPKLCVANGLWVGQQPEALKCLTFVEQLLVARVRHNKCLVRISSSGRAKLSANVIMFQNPTPEIYSVLPPSNQELCDVLAYVFIGHAKPTVDNFRQTPMLVRRDKVRDALQWLKANHCDYSDLTISLDNLNSYPIEGVPVVVEHFPSTGTINPLGLSSTSEEALDDAQECRFAVHGLTGHDYTNLSIQALKARALQHLQSGGSVLGIGHTEQPLSIFNNPQLYPQMFPCLFPYGYGGFNNARMKIEISDATHKKWLMNFHDKRFQRDLYFPMVAFNHEQIKRATTGSFLYAKRNKFPDIAARIKTLSPDTLKRVADGLESQHTFKPSTEEEKRCLELISDIHHTGSKVQGSMTAKRQMRNEIWSLIKARGAPTWFITFSPADAKHPLCLYYAGSNETFNPTVMLPADRNKLVSENPAAAAKCFNFIVKLFIKHILGVDADHDGLYGKTSAYYATVEQQGRLTLHLHALIWIAGALSPQEIRERIMSWDQLFESELVRYLESCCKGDFMTGDFQTVSETFRSAGDDSETSVDPTLTLPDAPPITLCQHAPESGCCCEDCNAERRWWASFSNTVDNILIKSNVHNCRASIDKLKAMAEKGVAGYNGLSSLTGDGRVVGCMNKFGECTARFPRAIFPETVIDRTDGHINLKKKEPMINTFSYVLTYLLRCNTDVTCVLSGTTVKALVAYITDYISKSGLSTHHIFKVAYDVLTRDREKRDIITNDSDYARRIILKMVNSLAAKMEVGSPLACSYLLGFPDHYTNVSFVSFWWRSFVNVIWPSADSAATSVTSMQATDNVMLYRKNDDVLGLNIADDYRYRPMALEHMPLYAWIQCTKRVKRRQNTTSAQSTRCFMPEHPLYESHELMCDKRRLDFVIPDFVGGTLPRKDQGDIEYYYCTMLTLFKPWRSASDLKPENVASWSAAYDLYSFPEKYKQIMANFNLVYECLDARDDFSATRKKHGKGDEFSSSMDYEIDDCDLEVDRTPSSEDDHEWPEVVLETHPLVCEIDRVVDGIGWSLSLPVASQQVSTAASESLTPDFPRMDWKAVVEAHRQNVLCTRQLELANSVSYQVRAPGSHLLEHPLVTVLPPAYFQNTYLPQDAADHGIIVAAIDRFGLNKEQRRAFRIVANHATSFAHPQLLMYLGGMGGTGKTRVLKALASFFEQRKQSNRLVAAAPTGTASSLLGGSTYHYLLGINYSAADGKNSRSATSINLARDRLRNVDYIFLDEISMVACHELCAISRRLADIRNVHDLPFGGLNIIFAGDFAQLPPVAGKPLYSALPMIVPRLGQRSIDNALGLFYWHQVTTVVILRQNMRQVSGGSSDSQFRTALQNMRTASCTLQDVAFLNTRIVNSSDETRVSTSPHLRQASVIVARNLQKDRLNALGVERFANDTGQILNEFYASDYQVGAASKSKRKRPRETILRHIQKILWDADPSSTGMIPGKLRLCYGLPVLIKHNVATELCITNGQEAKVIAWHSTLGAQQMPVLTVVFVELTNPPAPVMIEGLPPNVVPITPVTNVFQYELPRVGIELTVDRSQVPLLPNFAMTDFASQGKTRNPNIVDLAYCRSHQSVYTCLSRGSTAGSTFILRPFDSKIITSGANGWLRQEFRSLDILDKITELRFDNKLAGTVTGKFRRALIQSYKDSLSLIDQEKIGDFVRELDAVPTIDENIVMRIQQVLPSKHNVRLPGVVCPYWGCRWDAANNSCAYDAILSLLFNVWTSSKAVPALWSFIPQLTLSEVISQFTTVSSPLQLRLLCDDFRRRLQLHDPIQFQQGAHLTDLFAVLGILVGQSINGYIYQACRTCGSRMNGRSMAISPLICPTLDVEIARSTVWVSQVILCSFLPEYERLCEACYINGHPTLYTNIVDVQNFPPVMFVDLTNAGLTMDLSFGVGTATYSLRGVIYHGNNHFTARFRTGLNHWWFHDGIVTGDYWSSHGEVGNLAVVESTGAQAAVAVYLRQ